MVVLIDSGASHNFIKERLIKELDIPLAATGEYGIMLGTGTSINTNEICRGVILTLADLTIVEDFLPLSLGSADVILGIQWLMTLGKVQCDWRLSEMEFKLGDWLVQLKGDRGLIIS